MKTKKFSKKLSLHKETVTQLAKEELELAKGGWSVYWSGCWSCAPCRTVDTGCYPNCTVPYCPY